MAEGVPVGRARYTMTCGVVCVNCFKFISTLLNHSPNVKSHAYYKRGVMNESIPTGVATGETSHIESCGPSDNHHVRRMMDRIPSTINYSRRRSSDHPIADERDQLFPRPSQQQPRRAEGSTPTKLEGRWPESL